MLDIVPNCNSVQYKKKLMIQIWEDAKKTLISGLILDPQFFLSVLPLLVRHSSYQAIILYKL